jgi:hypothetical protein
MRITDAIAEPATAAVNALGYDEIFCAWSRDAAAAAGFYLAVQASDAPGVLGAFAFARVVGGQP